MSNTLVTSTIVAKEALAVLENMLSFSKNVNRDYEDEFGGAMAKGYAPGQTINIKRPPRYTYRAGRVSVAQSTVETTVPLTLSQGGCDMSFTSAERTLSLTKLEDKLMAAMAPIANEIDRQGLMLAAVSTPNALNPTGALPTTQALALAAVTGVNQRLDEAGAPRDRRRSFIMNPAMNASMIQGFAGLFNSQKTVSKQFDSGMMVDSLGIAYGMDQNVATLTNGAQVVAGTNVNGANQTGAAITVVATGGTMTRGQVVTFPGVFAVNPQSRQSTGVLAQFVITADLPAGAVSLPISPALTPTGAFQNVTASPTTGAAWLSASGAASTAYGQNIAFHRDAFTLAMVKMWAPPGGKGVIDVAQESHNGFTIKCTEFYDGINDVSQMRCDVLFGFACTYPELSVRYLSI